MKYFLAALVSLLTACYPVAADHTGPHIPQSHLENLKNKKFRLALVLGSGGPRGFAHIGVLKKLEELDIHPDLIVGASIGSVIGALWASGMKAAEIEERVKSLSLTDLFFPTWSRYGYFENSKLGDQLNSLLHDKPIEQMLPSFIPVATQLPEGQIVAFTEGNLGLAVQASSAIPKIIVPVKINGTYYSDADLSSPLPIHIAKLLNAEKIIAIDVSAFLEDTPSLEKKLDFDWISTGIYRKRLVDSELSEADLAIHVHLPYYAGRSKTYIEMAVARGMSATLAVQKKIISFRAPK
jgi:NTE family protein